VRDADQPTCGIRFLDELDRGFPRDRERHERIGKEHRVPERKHGQIRRHLYGALGLRARLGNDRVILFRHPIHAAVFGPRHKKRVTG
jgi:hypothetical protein